MMPKILDRIDHLTLHPCDSGVSTVSVWLTEGRAAHDRVTFSPFDLFDYRFFCGKVLESTGHPFACPRVDEAPDAWQAETRWRQFVCAKLEEASVEPVGRVHWMPLAS